MAKKILAMFLALCMCVSILPVQARAEENTETTTEATVTTENGEGGNATIVVTIDKPAEGTTGETGNADVSTASAEGETPAAEGEAPAAEVEAPAGDEAPAAEDETPAAPVAGTVTETETSETTTEEGLTEVTTTTTTTTTAENGDTTVTVTKETATDGTTEEGVTVDRDETYTEKTETVTDAEGTDTTTTWVEEGTETKEWSEEITSEDTDLPEVEVELVPGETNTETVTETETTVTGDVPENEEDPQYDYTETTTTTEREVSVETSDVKVTVDDTATGVTEMKGLAPVYDVIDGVKEDKKGVFDSNYLRYVEDNSDFDSEEAPENGEYYYVGVGEHTKYFVGFVDVVYEKDENGNTVYNENGEPVIAQLLSQTGKVINVDGKPTTDLSAVDFFSTYTGTRPTSFTLMDKEGNLVGAYCCDQDTAAVLGSWYSVSNLEDSDHYATEEAAEHIRAIALNGYWGTSDIPDEDGNYQLGSLEYVKEQLKAAIINGDIAQEYETYLYDTDSKSATYGKVLYDEDGNPMVGKFDMLKIIDGLTEGEALVAMQAAIWSYSDGSQGALSGEDGYAIVTPVARSSYKSGNSIGKEALDNEGGARVEFLYNWLMNVQTEEESTTIINEKNFVEDMSLTVGDKVDEVETEDEQGNKAVNGIYDVAMNFTLAFIPGENDDLLVQLKYIDLDGVEQTVTKRLAGENAEGQSYETITAAADGSYTIGGLKLSENKDFNFDLRLEGTQYLENGVYIYTAVGGVESSQTFVGVAEGERNVDVTASMTVSFSVDEEKNVVAQRVWRDEGDPVTEHTPAEPTEPAEPVEVANHEEDAPRVYRLNNGGNNNVETIPDEEVPLAENAITGDESGILIAMVMIAAFGLIVMFFNDKKRKAA